MRIGKRKPISEAEATKPYITITEYEELAGKYKKAQQDISDLTAALEAIQKKNEEIRQENKELRGANRKISDKHMAATQTIHRTQGW